MIELDFIDKVIIFRFKDHQAKSFTFKQLKYARQGYRIDDFTIEFNNPNEKPMTYTSAYMQ